LVSVGSFRELVGHELKLRGPPRVTSFARGRRRRGAALLFERPLQLPNMRDRARGGD